MISRYSCRNWSLAENRHSQHTPFQVAVKFQDLAKNEKFFRRPPNCPVRALVYGIIMNTSADPILKKLHDLGLKLPQAPKPVAAYIPAVRTGNLIFVSGQIPFSEGKLIATGPVPSVVSVDEARSAARQCVLNGLAVIVDVMGVPLMDIRRIVRLGVFVCCDAGFGDQPKVANGASELLQELFGENGRHARAAVGSIALPLNATVEVEMVVEVASH